MKLYHAAYAILLLCFGATLNVVYWSFFPREVVHYNRTIEVSGTVFRQGDLLVYSLDYCKSEAGGDEIAAEARNFVNEIRYSLVAQAAGMLEPGCHVAHFAVTVPLDIPPGLYKLEVTRTYFPNPIRRLSNTLISAPFEVIVR